MPYGVSLIISPFNFPILLTLGVLAAALCGGNTAVIKASSKSAASTAALQKLIAGTFPEKYVTVIDREGSFQFEPICIKDGFFTIWNGYFLAKDADDKWNIYDINGNKLRCITDDMMPYNPYGVLEYTDMDEGFLTITYDQKKYKMLYSVENAVNGEVRIP